MVDILRTRIVSRFSCLGERCEDTCCQNWSMQVDEPTVERYRTQAPELMDAVEQSEEVPWIMRKDPQTRLCVKLDGGMCGIHKKYGDGFLGDACHFYPRVTRSLGEQHLMTATLSCPEIVRLALQNDEALQLEQGTMDRLPQSLKDYLPGNMSAENALALHQSFIAIAHDPAYNAEMNFLRLLSVSHALSRVDSTTWPQAAGLYGRMAAEWMPPAQTQDADPFNLLHALAGLIVASHKPMSPRLKETVSDMETALASKIDWEFAHISTTAHSLNNYHALRRIWKEQYADFYAPVLRRYLATQLSVTLFPFAGLGADMVQRATIIGVRLASIKLALICSTGVYNGALPQDVVVSVIQSLSRFLDHLGDPTFSLSIYKETGWDQESRLRGLLEQ